MQFPKYPILLFGAAGVSVIAVGIGFNAFAPKAEDVLPAEQAGVEGAELSVLTDNESATTTTATATISLFFAKDGDTQEDCSNVYAVRRVIPWTSAIARATSNALLAGPTQQERGEGYTTYIPNGVELRSISLHAGVLSVNFSEEFNQVSPSGQEDALCRASVIQNQITKTLMQFPAVYEVVISVSSAEESMP